MLTEAVAGYVALRRAAGFSFNTQAAQLKSFAAFSEAKGEHRVGAQIAIKWAGLAPSVPQRARRLGVVIRFSRHLHAEDERHEIPPPFFGAERRPRRVPYILSQEQVAQLVDAASRAGYRTLRRATYSTLFALLACTGLRVSEAIRLRLQDITPDGLLIRRSKFRKSRLVPLHQSARAGLDFYLQQRCPYARGTRHPLFLRGLAFPLLENSLDFGADLVEYRAGSRALLAAYRLRLLQVLADRDAADAQLPGHRADALAFHENFVPNNMYLIHPQHLHSPGVGLFNPKLPKELLGWGWVSFRLVKGSVSGWCVYGLQLRVYLDSQCLRWTGKMR